MSAQAVMVLVRVGVAATIAAPVSAGTAQK
jgi:hypothetical protein